jgi:hypothetical protein
MIFNSQAASALTELLPYLLVKKAQAEIALKANWYRFARTKMEPEEQALRKALHAQMRELNKRGC